MKFEMSRYVAVEVKDYEKALSFYKGILGFIPVKNLGNEMEMNAGPLNMFITDASKTAGNVYFEFKVSDFVAASNLLLKHGCVITHRYNRFSAMFLDPFGLRFHLFSPEAFDSSGNLIID